MDVFRKAISFINHRGGFDFLSDELYLKLIYWQKMGKKLNLKNPKRFNEKLQWLKLHDRKPEYSVMVDKYEVKNFVTSRIGSAYVIPTLGVWDKFEDIDFGELPDKFVLKCTHDSGGLVICKDKKKLDMKAAKTKINKSLQNNYYLQGREWPYKNVKPRILAEKYMVDLLRTNVKLMEFIVFSSAGFVFLCGALLIEPFVMVYTKGIDDISYSRIWFGVLMCLNQYLFCVRLPYQMLVEAAGHFKQTRNGAIVECVLNIVISVILVIKWGLIGVTIGTFCALVYRTTQYAIYSSTHILRRKIWIAGKNVLINIIEAVIVIFIIKCMPVWNVTSYLSWLIYAVVVGMITMFVIGASSFLFYRSEISLLSQKVKNALKRR